MATFADDSESEERFFSDNSDEDLSQDEDQDGDSNSKPRKSIYEKDQTELELERLVLGDRSGFRENLFKDDGLLSLGRSRLDTDLVAVDDDADLALEGVDDADLFFHDAPTNEPTDSRALAKQARSTIGDAAKETTAREGGAAWVDSDDERMTVSLATVSRLRNLRQREGEDLVSGTEYTRRLRQEFLRLNPTPQWVRDAEGRTPKRRRSEAGSASGSDDEDGEAASKYSAQPIESFLRDVRKLAGHGASNKKRKLRPEVIDIQRSRDIPDQHAAAVNSLSFHPQFPVLLSASTSSIIYLHHIAPTAHPNPNPCLTSVRAKGVDVRRTEFLHPSGQKVFFAGRRRYFHSWDLETGNVQKTRQMQGHQKEHKTMEEFKTSPCGRYIGIVASTKKGGGIINIMSTESMHWIAAARLDGRHGIADFAWWSDGEGMTILGKDGRVGEYSLSRQRFLGLWKDEGSVSAIALALGGHGGPNLLGQDRWVAIGSSSGIMNLYDRHDLVESVVQDDEEEGPRPNIKASPEPTKRFEQLVTPVTVLAFSPDGQLLAFASTLTKDGLRLVHLGSGGTVYRNWPTQGTPLGRVTSIAFGKGSEILAVGNDKGKVRLWEIRA